MPGGVFLGTSDFAAGVLGHLAESPFRPSLVVTLPDRRRGRGRRESPSPVADEAERLGIELVKSQDVNREEDREVITRHGSGHDSICAFGQLIREPLLSEVPLLNVHPSLLPRWRGAAPIERSIMAGDTVSGVCIMRLTAGLDSGPVAASEAVDVGADENFGSLSVRLADLGGRLLVETFEALDRKGVEWVEQDEDRATYAEKIGVDDRRIDLRQSAPECHDRVRALTPHIGAWLELADGERLGVLETRVATGPAPEAGRAGMVDGRLLVGCGEGALELVSVRPAGRKGMDGADYVRGNGLPEPAPHNAPHNG